jgi:hypothetical protein
MKLSAPTLALGLRAVLARSVSRRRPLPERPGAGRGRGCLRPQTPHGDSAKRRT